MRSFNVKAFLLMNSRLRNEFAGKGSRVNIHLEFTTVKNKWRT